MAVVELQHNIMKEYLDHSGSICFQKAITPRTNENFKKEYTNFYPDNRKHFELMGVVK